MHRITNSTLLTLNVHIHCVYDRQSCDRITPKQNRTEQNKYLLK